MPITIMLDRNAHPDSVGLIPSFLDAADSRPAAEQFDAHYQHGGGWRPVPGFELQGGRILHYPGDPPLHPLAMIVLPGELVLIYPYGFVAVIQPGGAFEVARMD
jgi:hypothetical protein